MNSDWKNYYEQTKNRPPSKLLIKALPFVKDKDCALDLGSGALKDSKYLLSEGFKEVRAVDKEPLPEDTASNISDIKDQRFHFTQSAFEKFEFPSNKFDLINASYSLPFILPDRFLMVWNSIKNSLKNGGVFTGQFFGVKDEWNTSKNNMTFHTLEEAKNLFKDFEILDFEEEEKDGQTADGQAKHWHVFHMIARKLG